MGGYIMGYMSIEIIDNKFRVIDPGRVQEVDMVPGKLSISNHNKDGLRVIVESGFCLGVALQGIFQLKPGENVVSIVSPQVATRKTTFSRN